MKRDPFGSLALSSIYSSGVLVDEGLVLAVSGLHNLQGVYPALVAPLEVLKKVAFFSESFFAAEQVGRWYILVSVLPMKLYPFLHSTAFTPCTPRKATPRDRINNTVTANTPLFFTSFPPSFLLAFNGSLYHNHSFMRDKILPSGLSTTSD
jgi:hypothetical protein